MTLSAVTSSPLPEVQKTCENLSEGPRLERGRLVVDCAVVGARGVDLELPKRGV